MSDNIGKFLIRKLRRHLDENYIGVLNTRDMWGKMRVEVNELIDVLRRQRPNLFPRYQIGFDIVMDDSNPTHISLRPKDLKTAAFLKYGIRLSLTDKELKKNHRHDCEKCMHLGSWESDALYDLYYCPQAGLPTVRARYGDNDRYFSGIFQWGLETHPALMEARMRAIVMGCDGVDG